MEDKCKKYVFLKPWNRGHQMFFGVLLKMPCAIIGVRPNVRPSGHEIFSCPYFLVLLFNVTTIWCPMLRPLSCLTMFCDHNFLLICRFKLQFSQNYINIDTDKFQHWFCYFVQSLWNKNTIYDRSNGRIFYHIFIPYKIPFSFCSILFSVQLCKTQLCKTRVHMGVYTQFEY